VPEGLLAVPPRAPEQLGQVPAGLVVLPSLPVQERQLLGLPLLGLPLLPVMEPRAPRLRRMPRPQWLPPVSPLV